MAGGTDRSNDQRLLADAQAIKRISEGLDEQLTALMKTAGSTSEYWDDVAQTEFQQRCEEYQKTLKEQIQYLAELSGKATKYANKSIADKEEGKRDFSI